MTENVDGVHERRNDGRWKISWFFKGVNFICTGRDPICLKVWGITEDIRIYDYVGVWNRNSISILEKISLGSKSSSLSSSLLTVNSTKHSVATSRRWVLISIFVPRILNLHKVWFCLSCCWVSTNLGSFMSTFLT